MKHILKKAAALVMTAALTAGLLSGCATAYDPVQEIMGYSGDTVFFTVNGNDVTAGDYFFWMAQNIDTIQQYYGALDGDFSWDDPMSEGDDTSMDDYVKDESQNMAVMYNVVAAKAEEAGYSFTAEDEEEYNEQIADAKEQLGGEEEYATYLKGMCLTEEGMKKLSSVGVMYSHLEEGMFRDGAEEGPEEGELAQYAEDNGYMYAKHILLMTVDSETDEDLSDADKQAKKEKAEEIAAQLKAITDPEELNETFDKLMNENSEDTGLSEYPDGYTFLSGQMVEEFENAVKGQEPGQVSDVVESDYGYHIIMTLDPADSADVLAAWQEEQSGELLNQWMEEAEIETTEQYDNLTTAEFYEKLTAFRDTLETEEEETAETDADSAETEEPIDDGDVNTVEETTDAEAAEDAAAETTEEADAEAEAAEETEEADADAEADTEAAAETEEAETAE